MGKIRLGNLKCNAATFDHFSILGLNHAFYDKVYLNSYDYCHDKSPSNLKPNIS